jgi:Zn-dependent peptidase ImmA (M78 family)
VTTWREANTNAALMAARTHVALDIDLDRPIDVFAAVKELGLVLAFAPLGQVSGVYLPGERSKGILLHEGHPRTRQRYTAAHELGHHVFDHATEVDLDLDAGLTRGDSERWPSHEKEAEAFAAWFLMSQKTMRSGLTHLGIDRPHDPYDVYALSLWLGTSYTATARQLAITEMVDADRAQQWTRIPPRNLKLALAGELAPDDLQNDVWWLDARHNMLPVNARPGDRIVLTLEEIPSSGFTWRFTSLPDKVHVLADSYAEEWQPDPAIHEHEKHEKLEEAEEIAGGGPGRSFVLDIDPQADDSIDHLALVKEQPWDPDAGSELFELLVSIRPRLHGVQLPESEFASDVEGPTAS